MKAGPKRHQGTDAHLEGNARGGNIDVALIDELADRLDELLEEGSLLETGFEHCEVRAWEGGRAWGCGSGGRALGLSARGKGISGGNGRALCRSTKVLARGRRFALHFVPDSRSVPEGLSNKRFVALGSQYRLFTA
eukprot:97331-Rhodomonas_salina.1